MKRPPTDFELLRAIYERHRKDYERGRDDRASDVMVPLDVPGIADELGVNAHSVFGRLYYHLQPKYGEETPKDGRPRKAFFVQVVGSDRNAVNFPLLEAVLAGLRQQRRRDLWALATALVSIGIALAALVVSSLSA